MVIVVTMRAFAAFAFKSQLYLLPPQKKSHVTNFIVCSSPAFLKIQSSVTILIFNALAL